MQTETVMKSQNINGCIRNHIVVIEGHLKHGITRCYLPPQHRPGRL